MAHHSSPVTLVRKLIHVVLGLALGLFVAVLPAQAANSGDFVTTLTSFWVDPLGSASLDDVRQLPGDRFQKLEERQAFELNGGALWLQLETPKLSPTKRWFLVLEGAAFTDLATLYVLAPHGQWTRQDAGDHLPVAYWPYPDRTPVFGLDATPGSTVWLRLQNHPSPLSPSLQLLDAQDLQNNRDHSLLLLGGYLGFVLLVLFLAGVHVQLYGDRVFVAYFCYVACMLGFQLAFTGLGGLLFWPTLATWNDAAPALFMLWLTASGIWFVREVAAVQRHHRGLYHFMTGWSLLGFVFPALYFLFLSTATFKLLNLYGLLSVMLSMAVCIWAWRKGEVYAGWTALGFLPLHLAYPFPALRSAGLLADSWLTQYAVLIGSAIEIPLLLYILHRRAKDFNENRARMRVIDTTDPLTGLTILPVLLLRLADTHRRARGSGGECALVLVDLSNHEEIVASEGREMGDRALVVAAAQLSSLVRDVDTVCRVADTRFAILLEAPFKALLLRLFAQHIIAKGLAAAPPLPLHLSPRFRVATMALAPQTEGEYPSDKDSALLLLDHLHEALNQLDTRKAVVHLVMTDVLQRQNSAPVAEA